MMQLFSYSRKKLKNFAQDFEFFSELRVENLLNG